MTATVLVSSNGLKMPIISAKGETTRIFRRMNPAGIPPKVSDSTGNRKKGSSAATSWGGKETTVTRNSSVTTTLTRGSRQWTMVLP